MWQEALSSLASFLLLHALLISGFLAALVIAGQLFLERRTPAAIFSWGLFAFFLPYLGLPLYFLFGGRKSRRLVQLKKAHRADGVPTQTCETDNQVRLLPHAQATYHALYDAIEKARNAVYMQTYILGSDTSARRIIDLLARKRREGLDVRLLVDGFGARRALRHVVEPLKSAHRQSLAVFLPLFHIPFRGAPNLRNHRKITLIDHRLAIVGGQNIDQRFINARCEGNTFLDFSVTVEGSSVRRLEATFLGDWAYATRTAPGLPPAPSPETPAATPGTHRIEVIESGPDCNEDGLWERILVLAQECRKTLTIVTPYFVPDDVLHQCLRIQARCGRRIRIIVPESSNLPLVDLGRYYHLRRLHEAGAHIHFFTGGVVHAKLLIADHQVALTGSANLDMRSLFINFEIGLVHYSPDVVADLQKWADDLLPRCIPFEKSPRAKVTPLGRYSEDLAYLLSPLL